MIHVKQGPWKPDPSDLIGVGGEAEVYSYGRGQVLKLFKTPDHPDFALTPEEGEAARRRLEEHQRKLLAIPDTLPPRLVAPRLLAESEEGRGLVGYAMDRIDPAIPLLRFAQPSFRKGGPGNNLARDLLLDIRETLQALHQMEILVGDLNDANLLVQGSQTFLIDVDSYQFPGYPCRVFTERFLDPRLAPADRSSLTLARPYDVAADWYSFALLVFQTLLWTSPWGGIHRPPPGSPKVPPGRRALQGLSLYNPSVRRPRASRTPDTLPEELNQYFLEVLERDRRDPLPVELLRDLEFRECRRCRQEYASPTCPDCKPSTHGIQRFRWTVRGNLEIESVFETPGRLLDARMVGGSPVYLSHAGGVYYRNRTPLLEGPLDPDLLLQALPKGTLLGRGSQLHYLPLEAATPGTWLTARTPNGPSWVTTQECGYFLSEDQILRLTPTPGSGPTGPLVERPVGQVLTGTARVWGGADYLLGTYRAGSLNRTFLLEDKQGLLRDDLESPPLPGTLLDVRAYLGRHSIWILHELQIGGKRLPHVRVYSRTGDLLGDKTLTPEDHWGLPGPSRLVAGSSLLAGTDSGLVRIEWEHGNPRLARRFPDTAPYLNAHSPLRATSEGLLVLGERRALRLQLTPDGPRGARP